MSETFISVSAWAKTQGFSRQYAHQLINQGIIPTAKGKINPPEADAALQAYRGLSQAPYIRQRRVSKPATCKVSQANRTSLEADEALDAPKVDLEKSASFKVSKPSVDGSTYLQARTAHEVLKAQTSKVRLQSLKGTLIDREKASAHVFALARAERETWLNWPARIAGPLSAALGVEEHVLYTALDSYIRQHLTELGDMQTNFESV